MDRTKIEAAYKDVVAGLNASSIGHSALAEIITEVIQPNHIDLSVFNSFLPTRQLNIGDVLVKKVSRTGHPVRVMVPGTTHLSDPFFPPKQTVNYAIDSLITKMRMNLLELRRGELGTLQDFTREMQMALIDNIVARVYNLISQTWNGSTSRTNFVDATSTGVTIDILDNMVETVSYYAGDVRAIVGTRSALLPVYKANGIVEVTDPARAANVNGLIGLPDILMEWKNTGRLATFRGIPIVELPQVFGRGYNNYDTPLIDTSRVLVIGQNAGEVVLYGGVETQESYDLTTEPGDYVLAMWRSYGLILTDLDQVGVIKVNGAPTTPYHIA